MPKHPHPEIDPRLVEVFGEPISIYTREQALKDGVLVDVTAWAGSGPDGMLAGFVVPVAFTQALWGVVDIDDPGFGGPSWQRRARAEGESTRGRAHDVLWMASLAARRAPEAARVQFAVLLTRADGAGRACRHRVVLEAQCDADGITFGFPEDF